MCRSIYLLVIASLFAAYLSGQTKIAEISSTDGFTKSNEAAGYYCLRQSNYLINQQIGRTIHRYLYNSNFVLQNSYSFRSEKFTFNRKHTNTPVFASELLLENNYEIFSDYNSVLIVQTDFNNSRDSIVYQLDLSTFQKEEKRLAIILFSKGLRVLSYSQKTNKLLLYEWQENGKLNTSEYLLPASSLSPEEIKKYTKDARIKYKNAFDNMNVSPADATSITGNAGSNAVFYSENRIWLLSRTPYATGYNILELNMESKQLQNSNIMINDMRKNNESGYGAVMTPYAVVSHNLLIIRNSSHSFFEYHIYDINNRTELKKYEARSDDALRKIMHSDLRQKGTWLSGNDEKKLDNERAFMRKLNNGSGFLAFTDESTDSFTVTTGGLVPTSGLTGLLLSIGTGALGYMANLTIGNYQIVPYLELYRNKIIYCHSRFSKETLESSAGTGVTTTFDTLLDNFEKRDLRSGSSFIMKKDGKFLAAIFNAGINKFELYSLNDDQKP